MGVRWRSFRRILRFGNMMKTALLVEAIRYNWPDIKHKLESARDEAGKELMEDPMIRDLFMGIQDLYRSIK